MPSASSNVSPTVMPIEKNGAGPVARCRTWSHGVAARAWPRTSKKCAIVLSRCLARDSLLCRPDTQLPEVLALIACLSGHEVLPEERRYPRVEPDRHQRVGDHVREAAEGEEVVH